MIRLLRTHLMCVFGCAGASRGNPARHAAGKIMNGAQYTALQGMLPPRRGEWRLLHDTTRDGGVKHTKFHEMCDGKGTRARAADARMRARAHTRTWAAHTVVVLRDGEGSIYGGYADVAWHSRNDWVRSSGAFLFCLASSKATAAAPFKMSLTGTKNERAIRGDSGYGVRFGWGPNLGVQADGLVLCDIGDTYTAGSLGATLSTANPVAVTALEVWQLADS